MVSKVSYLETIAWQQRSIVRSKLGIKFEPPWSNATWLVTVRRGKSCDTITTVKLYCGVEKSTNYIEIKLNKVAYKTFHGRSLVLYSDPLKN